MNFIEWLLFSHCVVDVFESVTKFISACQVPKLGWFFFLPFFK